MDLPFSLATFDERLRRVMDRMKGDGIDALLVNLPDNLFYLCGHEAIGYFWFQTLVVSPALPHPVFITRVSEQASVDETSNLRGSRYYQMHFDDPIEILAGLLAEIGLGSGVIGVEMQAFNIRPAHWDRMKQRLPEASFKDASLLVLDERLIKSPEELAYQRSAARIADHAMRAGFATLRPGISEIEIAGVVSKALADAGGEYPSFPVMVVSGPRSPMIHGLPGNRRLEAGDVVTFEFAGVWRRYHAVMMRTAVIGRPSPGLRDVADCVKEATAAAIAAARAGNATSVPKHAADEVLDRLDLSRRRVHRVGYSVGIGFPPAWVEVMALETPIPIPWPRT